jgi:hypothetical protein
LDLRAAAMLAGGKGSMVTPLKKGREGAENRLKRGRYANYFSSAGNGLSRRQANRWTRNDRAVEIVE